MAARPQFFSLLVNTTRSSTFNNGSIFGKRILFSVGANTYCTQKPALAPLIRIVREKTGAGMMECKKYLEQNNYDVDKAVESLQKLARSATGRGRTTNSGWIGLFTSGSTGVLCELQSETDFVASNEKFKSLAATIAQRGLENSSNISEKLFSIPIETLKDIKDESTNTTIGEKVSELIYTTGESINLTKCEGLKVQNGLVNGYVHGGRLGILVGLEGGNPTPELARSLAVHIAACAPKFIYKEDATPDTKANEILTEQQYLHNEEQTVNDVLVSAGNPKVSVHRLVR